MNENVQLRVTMQFLNNAVSVRHTIANIKLVRGVWRLGLREAKDLVERERVCIRMTPHAFGMLCAIGFNNEADSDSPDNYRSSLFIESVDITGRDNSDDFTALDR